VALELFGPTARQLHIPNIPRSGDVGSDISVKLQGTGDATTTGYARVLLIFKAQRAEYLGHQHGELEELVLVQWYKVLGTFYRQGRLTRLEWEHHPGAKLEDISR
jgi:hypothetical protein